MQAIVAGTLNAAKSIAVDDFLGTIDVGKFADLIVLKEDPLVEITAIQSSIEKIMLNGLFVK